MSTSPFPQSQIYKYEMLLFRTPRLRLSASNDLASSLLSVYSVFGTRKT
ncbi:hypothetical protein HID58_000024 [Brassica napus]|uniref:Uncharacterized protein n=1 Tax=Brassica napus TaxID=3708 RepID=A0ABQ8EGD3_BRANA|nr:hypothetical protein HID58_000024 [Brassica napus]